MVETVAERKYGAAVSYLVTMFLVGLPIWWKTTEVYRANLPYPQIESMGEISTIQSVSVLLVSPDADRTHSRGPQLQTLLSQSTIFDVSLTVRQPSAQEKKVLELDISAEDLDVSLGQHLQSSLSGSVALLETPSRFFKGRSKIIIGNYRTVYFCSSVRSEEIVEVLMDQILGEADLSLLAASMSQQRVKAQPTDTMRKPAIGSMDIYLSLLIPEPEYVLASWDISLATQKYLQPFLDRFPLNLRVKSEIHYLTSLNIPGSQNGQGPLEVTSEELGVAVNSVETALSSQTSSSPALNLLLYIPPIRRTPLTLKNSQTNSFLLPRWGGVHIYNYHLQGEDNVKFPIVVNIHMESVMGIWIGQLRRLLGVKENFKVDVLPTPHTGLRSWEIDYQLRYRSLENIVETRSTLTSLSALIQQISNIVIRDEIGRKVELSIDKHLKSCNYLLSGRLDEGHRLSEEARENSESAFFDPSLLALLYFPDDQKYAIYIPYFLPVGIPILMSVKPILAWLKARKVKRD